MSEIHITCNQDDWSLSLIQVQGLPNISFHYAFIVGAKLPEPQKAQFDRIIEMFRAMGAQEWFASFVACRRQTDPDAVAVFMEVDTGYMKEEVVHVLTDADSIALYDTLTSEDFWWPILEERKPKKNVDNGQA